MSRRSASAPVTLRDIAARLGLSHSTVSRALSGHPGINPETRARVLAAAQALGYVANASARALRGSRSTLIGLVIPDIQNEFYAAVARLVTETLARSGYQTVLAVTDDDALREAESLRDLVEARAAGVIITPCATPRSDTLTLLRRMPVVQLARTHARIDADSVVIDDHAGIYAATQHLLVMGHRHIAYIGSHAGLSTGAARLQGFYDAHADAGVSVDDSRVLLGVPRPAIAQEALSRLMRQAIAPDAVVTGSSELTLGALLAAQSQHYAIPRQFSLTGYGNPAWFSLVCEGISTVQLPVEEVGLTAATLLLRRVESLEGAHAEMRFRPRLVIRSSTSRVNHVE